MCRYPIYLAVSWTFLLFLLAGAAAQEKSSEKTTDQNAVNDVDIIEESKFKEILSKATKNLRSKSYRLSVTKEIFSDRNAAAVRVELNILEFVSPFKQKEVVEVRSPNQNTRMETIRDGKNLYKKENDGEWIKFDGPLFRTLDGWTGGEQTVIYRFLGKESFNEQTVDVYEMETHTVSSMNYVTAAGTSRIETKFVDKKKYWISEDGCFLKTSKESETVGKKSLTRKTEIYEYDPNIKIEAPIK